MKVGIILLMILAGWGISQIPEIWRLIPHFVICATIISAVFMIIKLLKKD